MTSKKRLALEAVKPFLDLASIPFTAGAAAHMKLLRRVGMEEMPATISLLKWLGVFPIRNHYYEPLFDDRLLRHDLAEIRELPGIDLNLPKQLEWLSKLSHVAEIADMPENGAQGVLHFRNGTFQPGDIDALYGAMRAFKPRRYLEIGSGNSTLVALEAASRNNKEGRPCEITCIEPYEMSWLETTEANIIRKRVELLDSSLVANLEAGDILFIDSSHMIRPQGDVLFIFQELLPQLAPGVLVHVHDIFTPRDYPEHWLVRKRLFWNEQYLLEAFLAFNDCFEVLLAAHMLFHSHRELMLDRFELLAQCGEDFRPTSFWFRRI